VKTTLSLSYRYQNTAEPSIGFLILIKTRIRLIRREGSIYGAHHVFLFECAHVLITWCFDASSDTDSRNASKQGTKPSHTQWRNYESTCSILHQKDC